MAGGDLIDFEVIEGHKENIQALPSGRSARALAALYSPPLTSGQQQQSMNDGHSEARAEFEKEMELIEEADDPLDVYDRYVKWTLDTYPSAQSTPQSQLLPLLERATKAFLSSPQYKNDPRYLKLWLHYIRFFSDAPRETFVFLNRHAIAESLALYYEEFAAWLEHQGRWTQAEEVYTMGIEQGATPTARLQRKFTEFQQRNAARPQDVSEPTSPALTTSRPALAAKADPFAASVTETPQQSAKPAASKKKSNKMAIFTDDSQQEQSAFGTPEGSKAWDSIGSLQSRKKENTIEPKPMAGETLKTAKTNTGVPKMAIFRSSSNQRPCYESSNHASQRVVNPRTGRPECVFVNLEAVYPDPTNPSVEFCFEELRARHRGWMDRDWSAERREPVQPMRKKQESAPLKQQQPNKEQKSGFAIFQDTSAAELESDQLSSSQQSRGFAIFQDENKAASEDPAPLTIDTSLKVLPVRDENDENKAPSKQDVELAKRLRREERANRTRKIKVMDVEHVQKETQTIKLNLDSPTGPKIRKKKISAEPTMTINTKEAMDEIYGIFSQPVQTDQDKDADESESEDDSEDDSDDDYTSGAESTATGHISDNGSDYGDETRREILASQQPSQEQATEETDGDADDQTSVSAWSEYSNSKPISEATASADQTRDEYELSTPREEVPPTPYDEEEPKTKYIPLPPEDYEPVTSRFRDPVQVAQNRLPFMTPIVEQTESSIATARAAEKGYFGAKTPSRQTHAEVDIAEEDEEEDDDDETSLLSSPFQDVLSGAALEDKRKILQPVRTKTTKGIVSLSDKPKPLALRPASSTNSPPPTNQGPIIKDPQINPVDPEVRQTILSQINPPLSSYKGYHEHLSTTHARTPEIRKFARAVGKGKTATADKSSLPPAPVLTFPDTPNTYTLKRELGAGAFAPVYLIENSDPSSSSTTTTTTTTTSEPKRCPLEALKMEDPISAWEFYMLRCVHGRLTPQNRASSSIIHAYEMHIFRDEGFLIEEYRSQGTLLDLINVARSETSGNLDETLAMFFAVELIRTVEALHSHGLIHGDLKGDNVLVRFEETENWQGGYRADGSGGWHAKGISLIDFGRAIDMRCFSPSVQFVADWETSEADCAEMRELRPWTYQVDYHGLAGLLHSLLFGKYMSTVAEKAGGGLGQGTTKHYRIREGLKRYWQVGIWQEAFEMLLNPMARVGDEQGGKLPLVNGLRALREKMESWLEGNCDKGIGLKTMVRKMEEAVRARRK